MIREVVVFKLIDGTDRAAFLADAQATFDLLKTYPGYVDRSLGVSADGQWIDVVTWADLDAARSATEQVMTTEIGQAFGAHIDLTTMQMHHVHTELSSAPVGS